MDLTGQGEGERDHERSHSALGRGSGGSDLATFREFPPQPVLTKSPDQSSRVPSVQRQGNEGLNEQGMLQEGMEQQKRYYESLEGGSPSGWIASSQRPPQNVKYSSQLANSQDLTGSKDELMHKLNYLIHLLEEQKDEKTGNVTEELVLYMFLGVFVIFVVDSFARAGKYTR